MQSLCVFFYNIFSSNIQLFSINQFDIYYLNSEFSVKISRFNHSTSKQLDDINSNKMSEIILKKIILFSNCFIIKLILLSNNY